MIHIAVRVRELVSRNIDSMVDRAGDPRKMLKLLLTELEENLIDLHGDLTKTTREQERTSKRAEVLTEEAEAWTAKAKTAVDHKREDLARAALLARESGRRDAQDAQMEAKQLSEQISEIKLAIKQLETKREDVLGRLARVRGAGEGKSATQAAGDSKTALRMDRLDAIERRVAFGTEDADKPSPDAVDAEIAALQQESDIAAELAAMKKPEARRTRKKAK